MVVYADLLFLINFFMNYLITAICSATVPVPTENRRRLLASFLGGIYGVCVFIPDLTFLCSAVSVFVFSLVMVAVMFCPCGVREFFRAVGMFYLSSFLLAGGMYMLLPYIGGGVVRNNVVYYDGAGVAAVGAAAALGTIKLLKRAKKGLKRDSFFICVRYKDMRARVKGMTDTGNLLEGREGEPVIVGDEEILKSLFGKNCTLLNMSEWVDACDIRLIPYRTMDADGVMTGFVADEVSTGKKSVKNVVIAISPRKIGHGLLVNNANL